MPNFSESLSFETVACDNCGNNIASFLFSGHDRTHGLPGQFSMVQCTSCGWIRQSPRPLSVDLVKLYPKNYEPYRPAIEGERRFWKRWDRRYGMLKRCRSVERFVERGRLLEVGCGTGIFLNEMQKRGWKVIGVEPNRQAAEYAQTRFRIEVSCNSLEEFVAPDNSFDAICLWNVLEHLPFPAAGLRELTKMLRPGGVIVFSIPNLESLDLKLFRESWIGWELPRHLYLFPSSSLRDFLNRNGLKIIQRDCPAGSHFAFLLSLKIYLSDHFALDASRIDFIIKIMQTVPFRIPSFPLFWLIDLMRRSSVLTYYVRKIPRNPDR